MELLNGTSVLVEQVLIESVFLKRAVTVDYYLPRAEDLKTVSRLLLINDGQDLPKMDFKSILEGLYSGNAIKPIICAGIYCGAERKREYGVAGVPDYKGRGDKADLYARFIMEELLPAIDRKMSFVSFTERAFAGFSLGGLSALDNVWNFPRVFTKVGVFSGSLWWRSIDQYEEEYDDDRHRIMHQQIRNGNYKKGLRFFFQCGNMDETKDRNNNGIIDSIEDTLDLIKELKAKGYSEQEDLRYLELADGLHDVPTWGRAMPGFLQWGWGK